MKGWTKEEWKKHTHACDCLIVAFKNILRYKMERFVQKHDEYGKQTISNQTITFDDMYAGLELIMEEMEIISIYLNKLEKFKDVKNWNYDDCIKLMDEIKKYLKKNEARIREILK